MEGLQPDLTVSELAQYTRQAPQTIYKLCQEGHIPSYRVGRSIRIRREDVEAIRRPQPNRLSPELVAEVRKAVEAWPPLTNEQREAVAAIFSAASGAVA